MVGAEVETVVILGCFGGFGVCFYNIKMRRVTSAVKRIGSVVFESVTGGLDNLFGINFAKFGFLGQILLLCRDIFVNLHLFSKLITIQ